MGEPQYVKRIRGNFKSLITLISGQEIAIFMVQNGGLTVKEYEEILSTGKSIPHKENSALLLTVLRKGEETFNRFVEALNGTQMEYLAKHLMEYNTDMCVPAVKGEETMDDFTDLKRHGYIEARNIFFNDRLRDVMSIVSDIEKRLAELNVNIKMMKTVQQSLTMCDTEESIEETTVDNASRNATSLLTTVPPNIDDCNNDENIVLIESDSSCMIEAVNKNLPMAHSNASNREFQYHAERQTQNHSHRKGTRRSRRVSFSSLFCMDTSEKQNQIKPDFIHSAIVGAFTTGMLPVIGKEGVDILSPENKSYTGIML